jgi:hypothetical protein
MVRIGADAPQWDDSQALKEFLPRANRLRTLGYLLLIIVPAIASLLITWDYSIYGVLRLKLLWWFGALTSVLSTVLVLWNHVGLMKMDQAFNWASATQVSSTSEGDAQRQP